MGVAITLPTIGLILINVTLLVTGQILWKQSVAGGWLEAIATPYFWIGLGLYGVATFIWLGVLRRMSLSIAYPLQALAYPAGVLASSLVLGETPTTMRWVGVGVILLGVALVATS